MRADRFALGFVVFGLCAAGPLSCGDPFKLGSSAGAGAAGASAGEPSAGAGGPITCKDYRDCPGLDIGCIVRSCDQGICGKKPLLQPTSQIYGDCKVTKCKQDGTQYIENDDTDFYDDGNPCTDDKCDKGKPIGIPKTKAACGDSQVCSPSGACVQCIDNTDCAAGSNKTCTEGRCVVQTCSNGTKDGDESYTDCGGFSCPLCAEGKTCRTDLDCASRNCMPQMMCGASCDDHKQDGTETGTDCGGPVCGAMNKLCAPGFGCNTPKDCQSGVCAKGKCQPPSCTDGVKNGDETGIDCGGMVCGPCS